MLGLGLVVPWPVRVGVQCPADKPEMCEGNYWTWRDPVVIKLYYLFSGREVILFKGVRYEANSNKLSTPELIEEAFENGEINEGERILYLTYAISTKDNYELLPKKIQGNVPWDGAMVALEVNKTVSDPEVICGFELKIQNELQRIMPTAVSCE